MLQKSEKAQSGIAVVTAGAVLIIAVIVGLFMLGAPVVAPENTATLEKFSSYESLVAAFEKGKSYYGDYSYGMRDMMIAPTMAVNAAAEGGAGAQKMAADATASTYSKTNIQVEGVDEADIIKNDGKYIYAIAKGKIFIVDAYPAQNARIVSTIQLGNNMNPQEMFISDDGKKLMVFASSGYYGYGYYGYARPMVDVMVNEAVSVPGSSGSSGSSAGNSGSAIVPSTMMMPIWENKSYVAVITYDITDKANPKLSNESDFEGSYLNSRLIGDKAYFVINSYPDYTNYYGYAKEVSPITSDENNIIPMMRVNGSEKRVAVATDIAIMPRVRVTNFVTIASLDIKTGEMTKQTVAGSANNLYASQDNIFLAEQYWEYADYNGPIPLEAGMLMKSIYMPRMATTEKTVISKFHVENGSITFGGQGVAPGHILNQFSMDEYNNNFRIATTVQNYNAQIGENASSNNVYIFNKDMNMEGAIEGIAPNETIYSARFMGDKGYLVTFKTVDPLFVLDLSNPSDPKILGKLKIPGYSDYMQPIDETHILGIGKDVNEEIDAEKVHSVGAVYYTAIKGIKMAVFDVSDVANPKEMYKVVIGDRGTESEALNDHKALLFDKSKNLLVLPVTIVENVAKGEAYGQQSFQGALVYNLSLENGFVERGRITHVSSQEELKSGYYYDSTSIIRRSLFMDNVLYTYSNKMIKANDLSTLADIKEVPFDEQAVTQNQN